MMLSQDRPTTSRIGRKRSNQAAELSDVSIEEDSNGGSRDDGDLGYFPISTRRDSSLTGAETDEDRQVRRIPCMGRKRGSAKGTRGSNDDHSAKIPANCQTYEDKKDTGNDESDAQHSADSSRPIGKTEMPTFPKGASMQSYEKRNSTSSTTIPIEADSSGDIIAQAKSIDSPTTMNLDSCTLGGQGGSETDRISGMPDWAAELDEIVPGVKVISVKDAVEVLLEYHQLDTPTSVLFPWMHGIGDGPLGADGPLEQFFG
ncbi:hypothetical protein NliqN6_2089 [Naganishia liquefaciens]|uniref:Uncharacterized protein n=1 Tax=Naganishia liquefaciens TaxID=104408 RepID=A0A8H3TR54_9TREE|nr:hypothetical protein NliqN6_2089 [Naganishia liquefaciens]